MNKRKLAAVICAAGIMASMTACSSSGTGSAQTTAAVETAAVSIAAETTAASSAAETTAAAQMSKEELIALAEKARESTTTPLTDEEIKALGATQEELVIEYGEYKVQCYDIKPEEGLEDNHPLVINIHGGGFIKGRSDRDRVYCSNLANACNAEVIDVDYKLAPEYPFPYAMNECKAVVDYVFANAESMGVDKTKIAFVGHSSGGALVNDLCQLINGDSNLMPVGVIMDYFPADLVTAPYDKLSDEQKQDEKEAKRTETEALYNLCYVQDKDPSDPLISPINAEDSVLKNFPETMIIAGGKDKLHHEDVKFASRLLAQEVNVTCHIFEESNHGFTTNKTGEWEEAIAMQNEFLNRLFK